MPKIFQLIVICVLMASWTGCSQANSAQTSSARAAYGDPAPYKAHVKKNNKKKKQARKAARRKRSINTGPPYQRLPM